MSLTENPHRSLLSISFNLFPSQIFDPSSGWGEKWADRTTHNLACQACPPMVVWRQEGAQGFRGTCKRLMELHGVKALPVWRTSSHRRAESPRREELGRVTRCSQAPLQMGTLELQEVRAIVGEAQPLPSYPLWLAWKLSWPKTLTRDEHIQFIITYTWEPLQKKWSSWGQILLIYWDEQTVVIVRSKWNIWEAEGR